MRNSDEREKLLWRYLLTATMTTEQAVVEIVKAWTAEVDESWNAGYTEAAEDITQKLQECIPTAADTVPKAQVQGAWRDAANIAYNHLKGHTST